MTYDKDNIVFEPLSTHGKFQDLSGQVFYRLTVLGYAGQAGQSHWFVECECGNVTKVASGHLKDASTRSCGCYKSELARRGTHGDTNSPEYKAWQAAKTRCTNPLIPNYHDYGGRGIEFRLGTFEQFLEYMGRRPSPRHSLDRYPDKNGHYEYGNIRWATRRQQAMNKRSNNVITWNNVTQCLGEWADDTGIKRATIHHRLFIHGWCIECSLTVPPKGMTCTHREPLTLDL